MKLSITNPEKIKVAFFYNPGCLQPFSLSLKNLYYNLLPILSPKRKNVEQFLEKAIFHKPNHFLSPKAWDLLVGYEVFALTRYRDKTQKPYFMNEELRHAKSAIYLILGDHDLLFPVEKSISNAKALISNLKDIQVYQAGHGLETLPLSMLYLKEKIGELEKWE